MRVDEKEFFREATLRICSSLEIEKALWRCLMYIKDFIPADFIAMSYVSADIGGFRAIAKADIKGGQRIDVFLPLPSDIIDQLTKDTLSEVMIVDDPNTHPVLKHTVHHAELKLPSIMVARLIIDGQFLGSLTVMAEGGNRYTREHTRLFSLLRDPASIALSNSLRYLEVLRLKELLADDYRYLQDELSRISGEEIIGADFGLKGVMEMVRQVALLSSPVLLFGETGAGKEVIARAIHNLSQRREGPFIKVNCGAIPETLMDSELFGHEKGAFTGALYQKRGRFERADGGTIFLDEIGELSFEAQIRLLRVLQEKEIERVGGTRSIQLNIRVIAATHRDLQRMIQEGRFREDLFYRLQVFPITIPPLRQRTGDIPSLVQHFMAKKSKEMGLEVIPALAAGAIDRLMAYQWPGNVRELENAVERALILSRGESLAFSDLHRSSFKDEKKPLGFPDNESLNLDRLMNRHIRKVLDISAGRVEGKRGAAKLLGINPGTLRHRMRKLGIPFGRAAAGIKSRKTE